MDMQKIGNFLKTLRKEKGLTQEQLAEILGVAGRTVSRWENASNMPDLSILIQIAEFYNVEVKEILDGERKSEKMDKDFKETLKKAADYSKAEKDKASKIGITAFAVTFLVCAVVFLVQLLIFKDILFVIGEIIVLFIGGITSVIMTANNGLWDAMSKKKHTVLSDIAVSVVMSAVFTCVYSFYIFNIINDVSKVAVFAVLFFLGISALGFAVLRILAVWSKKRKQKNTDSYDKKINSQK